MEFENPACAELREGLPVGWDVLPLDAVTDFQEGPGILAKDFRDSGVPLLRLRNIETPTVKLDGCNFLDSEKVASKWKHFALRHGDLLISTSASLGRVSVVGVDAVGAIAYTGIIRFRSSSERLHHEYLRAFLSSSSFVEQAERMATGSVIRHFGPSHLRQMAITLPSIEEQVQIAEIFDVLDDRITLLRETNATLEGIAQALFKSWFVDFDPVRSKMEGRILEGMDEATAALFPDCLTDSKLGLLPRGWQASALDSIADVVMGLSPDGDSYNVNGTGTPLINGPVEFGEYFPELKKWTSAPTRYSKVGDLIFCVRGSTTGKRVVSDGEYCIGRGVAAIRSKQSCQEFVRQTINFGLQRLLEKTTGSVFPSLSAPDIKEFLVVVPDVRVLESFQSTVEPVERKIQENYRQVQTLESLRDTLLPRLISGNLRIQEAEVRLDALAA